MPTCRGSNNFIAATEQEQLGVLSALPSTEQVDEVSEFHLL
jgi:hypothetical protein